MFISLGPFQVYRKSWYPTGVKVWDPLSVVAMSDLTILCQRWPFLDVLFRMVFREDDLWQSRGFPRPNKPYLVFICIHWEISPAIPSFWGDIPNSSPRTFDLKQPESDLSYVILQVNLPAREQEMASGCQWKIADKMWCDICILSNIGISYGFLISRLDPLWQKIWFGDLFFDLEKYLDPFLPCMKCPETKPWFRMGPSGNPTRLAKKICQVGGYPSHGGDDTGE